MKKLMFITLLSGLIGSLFAYDINPNIDEDNAKLNEFEITSANWIPYRWGSQERFPGTISVTTRIQNACHGKVICYITPTIYWLTDPKEGYNKWLSVNGKCRNPRLQFHVTGGAEGWPMTIHCGLRL